MDPPTELSTASQGEVSPGDRSPGQPGDRPAAGSSAAPATMGATSSDPDSDSSDNPTDQSSDSLARSHGACPANSEPFSTRRERGSRAAPAHQALNSRVRLPMSVRLPAAPGSSHDSTQDSARDSSQESTQDSAQDSAAASDSDSKGTASGGSLTYVTPDEYIRHIYPRPARTHGSYGGQSREVSYSSESPELYFRSGQKYGRRSYGGLCLSMSIVAVIVAVIGIVSVAAYLGVVTKEDGKALQYEMQYSGQFRVLSGDFYHPGLDDTQSNDFKNKATRYQKMLETLYGASYISEAFRHADVHAFDGRPLTVFFRIHLDRRKIPKSILNTEEALRDVLTQEVMAIQPKAFRALELDINSIRISREKSWVGTDSIPASGRTGEDSTQLEAATIPQLTEGGVAPTARGTVWVSPGADVYQLEDWVGPPRAGSGSLSGRRPGDDVTLVGTGTESSPDRPAERGRPITEYQPSEFGDFPPALVGDELDLASAATVASQNWRTQGILGTGRPGVESWTEGGSRHRQTLGAGQANRQHHADNDGPAPGGSQHPHHRPRPHGDSSEAGVVTPPDGVDRVRLAGGGTGSNGGAARPPPPDIVPFIDRPSVQRPEYDRTPWHPLLPSRRQSTSGQRPSASELGGVQASEAPAGQGLGSVWPGAITGQPEEHRRRPGQLLPDQEDVLPVSDSSAPQTEGVQSRPEVSELNHETVLPVAFWPKPRLPQFQPPPQLPRPAPQNTPTVSSLLPGADKLGAGFLQMLSEFVLARTKPSVLSRTEATGQPGTEQLQSEIEQPQSETEQLQSETEQPQSETEQSQFETEQAADISSQVKEDSDTLPPVTVLLQPAPVKSKGASLKTELSIYTSADGAAETTTDIQPKTAENKIQTTKLPAADDSSHTSAVPDIIITFSAVNSTSPNIETFSAQPPVYLPDKLVRKTLTITSQDQTENSPYVTHPSGIISRSPLGSSDLLDPVTPPTTASPDPEGHHTETSEVSAQVTRSEVSDPAGQLGLTEDGEFVTVSSVVPLQTVPPHLHYSVVAGDLPDGQPTPAGAVETAGPAPVAPSPPGTSLPAVTVTEDQITAVTVTPEQGWEQDGHVTPPFFQPVTSYSGVYPPSRPKPPSLPHPEYLSPHSDSNPASSSSSSAGEEEDDYLYYDTEIFTEKNSVQSIFDMFSTRKPLVLDTDVVTSTSVREQATPERRLLIGLLRGASRRQGTGRARRPDRRGSNGIEGGVGKENVEFLLKEFLLKERYNGTTSALGGEDTDELKSASRNRREKRSLAWLRMSFSQEDQHDLPEPVSESRERQHAARSLPRPSQTPTSSHPPSSHPAEHTSPVDSPAASSLAARRVRRPSYSSQSVSSLAARLRLTATPTARPRRGSRLRLPPRREKLADKLMRFRGVRSRGIFATTARPARPARRWRAEGTTRLPNSAPIHVIKYDEDASVDDILDRIFETRREFDSSRENEVGSVEGAAKKPTPNTTASALWRTSEVGEAWQSSEEAEQWSPVEDSVPWSTSEESRVSERADRLGQSEPSSSSHEGSRRPESRLHSEDTTQTTNNAREDTAKPTRLTIRPPARLTARPAVGPPSRSSSRPPTRPPPRPTVPPTTTRPSTSRPAHQWRPVRFRLPTQTDWPKTTEPSGGLADKLSRLTTTPGPAVVSARPAQTAVDSQLVADTDNEVGTAGRPLAVVPTRPTLASLLSNFTYLEEDLTPPPAGCPGDQFRCVSGECVPRLSRCDLLQDCADGSDELVCTCADRLNAQFLERKICDGIIDCHDSTDEQFCDWCRPGQFICPGAKRCVPADAVCDGQYDCPDGADEHQCVTLAATRGAAGQSRYQPSGYLMVRRHGRWGPLCVDNFDALVRRTHTPWSVQELGRAVCSALTYNETTHVFRTESSASSQKRRQRQRKQQEDPFYQLVLSANVPRNNTDEYGNNTSLVFEEASCPRQTSVHITCDSLKCGLRPRVKRRQARIVGGTNSSPGAWPWQAAMYRDGEYQCGATLISDRWLLSAGHCFLRSTTNHWVARLGAYRRGSTLLSPFESLHQVSHIIVHPDYEDVGYVHDIALLKLADTVSMSDFVRPVCLPPRRAEVTEGALCSVVGWGQLFEAGRIFPDTLQEVELPLITSQQCKKRTSRLPLYKITDDMFCAGFDRGGRDACLGDSGGPLMCQEPSGEWTLTGITSNGYGCARALRPGVYTKVANYVDWIERVTTGPLQRARRTHCRGHRCPLGRCLKQDSMCDGAVDCADGSDEQQCSAAA